jgi:prepilin-type processing-associated H-X9-DG protein
MLFADCGVRPAATSATNPLDYSDVLCYSTNYITAGPAPQSEWGTLNGVALTPWLGAKIPLRRHSSGKPTDKTARVNVSFADGHGETVSRDFFNRVRVCPH